MGRSYRVVVHLRLRRRDAPTRDARSRRSGRVRFARSSATEIVLAFVQHDSSPSDAVQRKVGSVNGHVDDAPIARCDVAQITAMTKVVVQSSVMMRVVGIVVTSHACTPSGQVAVLVHVKPVQPVRHSSDAHVAKRDVHTTSLSRLAKRDSATPEGRGKRHFVLTNVYKKREEPHTSTPGQQDAHVADTISRIVRRMWSVTTDTGGDTFGRHGRSSCPTHHEGLGGTWVTIMSVDMDSM